VKEERVRLEIKEGSLWILGAFIVPWTTFSVISAIIGITKANLLFIIIAIVLGISIGTFLSILLIPYRKFPLYLHIGTNFLLAALALITLAALNSLSLIEEALLTGYALMGAFMGYAGVYSVKNIEKIEK